MDDGRSFGSALQPLKPISNHGVTLPRLSFLGNPSLQFCYKRIEYVALHQHGIKINNMNDWKTWMTIGIPGDKISSWLRQQMRDPHLPSRPCSLANPMRVSPGPGDEVGADPSLQSSPCTLANPLRNSPGPGADGGGGSNRVPAKKSGEARMISAAVLEECTRLTTLLRRRLSAGQARFGMTLRKLRVSGSLPSES